MKYTHKGWFFMCPIYCTPYGEGMEVKARFVVLEPWFTLNEWIFAACALVMTTLDPSYEPMFPFLITGELRQK